MKVLNKTEQIAHIDGKTSFSAIQNMLMGYRSTPHPATGHTPYESLMKRNVRTKLDSESFPKRKNYRNMEQEIAKRDKEYKKKWNDQQRRPKCKEQHFKIGVKILLKKRKSTNGLHPMKRSIMKSLKYMAQQLKQCPDQMGES